MQACKAMPGATDGTAVNGRVLESHGSTKATVCHVAGDRREGSERIGPSVHWVTPWGARIPRTKSAVVSGWAWVMLGMLVLVFCCEATQQYADKMQIVDKSCAD